MTAFAFLKDQWGLELQPKAQHELEANLESLTRKHIEDYIKDTDIRKFGITTDLPKDVGRTVGSVPPGKYFVQLTKTVDITQPARFQEDFEGGKWRLLKLDMADGEQKMQGLEYVSTKVLGVHLPPGTKLLLWSSKEAPLRVQNGHLLLTPDTVEVLGGNVEKLVEGWRASKEVEANRLLWRTEGIKKTDKIDAAPPWTDFDPKKAPRAPKGGHSYGAGTDDIIEKERAEWRKNTTNSFGPGIGGSSAPREEGSQRFQVDEFKQADAANVKSQVNSSAFAHAPERGRKGKGKGERKGYGKGDDGGEEKRAPVMGSTLAAFIKPTKDGKLPDEAINALAQPASASQGGGGGGQWDQGWDSWDAGWGEGGGGWSGGGGGGSWSAGGGGGGGGWGSSSWGGGGGGGKSGGKRPGGGKGGGGKKGGGGGGGGKRGGKGW